jgi:putative nucleotidyltransferase with HDIG domain
MIPVDRLEEGDLLGRGLYDPDGRLLLQQGVKLSSQLIEGIKKRGHQYIIVQQPEMQASGGTDFKSDLRQVTRDLLARTFQALREGGAVPMDPLLDWADHVAYSVTSDHEATVRLHDLKPIDTGLIAHSLNVNLLAMMTAKALGYSERQIHNIALGSLLHDIGLVLSHDGSFLTQHPQVGCELLRKQPDFPAESLAMVLHHHERLDGSGYPGRISGRQLSESAQIVGLCSEFDCFMNGGRTSHLPGEGVDFVVSKIDSSYSSAVVRAFNRAFQPYPVGTTVRLTGGLIATVCEQNRNHSCRPVVVLKQFGTKFDLMQYTTFMIEEVLDAH